MNDYEKYRLQWMIDHDCSLNDLFLSLSKYQDEGFSGNVFDLWIEWQIYGTFPTSGIWACKGEWEANEGKERRSAPVDRDVAEECESIIPNLEAYDKSKELYAQNEEFKHAVQQRCSYYWHQYDDRRNDEMFDCIVRALGVTYIEWTEG